MKSKADKINFLTIFKEITPNIIRTSPVYFIFFCINDILLGLSYGVNALFMQLLFDSINNARTTGDTSQIYFYAALVSGMTIFSQILNGVTNFMYSNMNKKLNGVMQYQVNQKSYKIRAIDYENPTTLDSINKAFEGSQRCVDLVFLIISMVAFHVPYLLFMFMYLSSIQPSLSVVLLFMFVPLMMSQIFKSNIIAKMEDCSAPLRREVAEYDRFVIGREFFKETRVLGIFGYIKSKYLTSLGKMQKYIWQYEKKAGYVELLMRGVTLGGYLLILFMLIFFVRRGEITIGEFAAVLASITLVISIMQDVVERNLGLASRNIGYAKNYIQFQRLPERIDEAKPNGDNDYGISISNMSFQYPNAKSYALFDINLKINHGETFAIVGDNGSGKSTLSKLIMGLYEPTSGSIDIASQNTKSRLPYPMFSAVFQKFCNYKLKLRENIILSQPNRENDISQTLEKIELSPSNFPQGLDTMLSAEFDGIELSGGQWQKVAIARGLYRVHDIIILDEPTAAIDPIEESNLYLKFAEISKNKTSIIITHRIGSVRIADRIGVLEKGRLVEVGNHDTLLAKNGVYAELFRLQADWYKTDVS